MRTRPRPLVAALICSIVIGLVGPAWAQWDLTGPGGAYAKAVALPAGGTPAATVTGRNVSLSWAEVSLPGGANVQGYRVRRYDSSSGAEATVQTFCVGLVTSLACTESAVPPGTWRYSVAPLHHNWMGAEGPRSSAVTVATPAMTFSSGSNVTDLPKDLSGNLRGFVAGANIVFRLDDPTSGPALAGSTTPAAIPNDGAATFSVTIPMGTSNGPHTVYAAGAEGDIASASIDVNVSQPSPTDVQVSNGGGGQTGRANQGDTVKVIYSEALDVSSLCSTWSGNALGQILNLDSVVSVTINDNAVGGNDKLVVSTLGACANNFRFGSIDLGSPSFVTGQTTFSGIGTAKSTVAWDATLHQLLVTLGAKSLGPNPARVTTVTTATYTPDPGILNPSGRAITGTATRSAIQF